MKMLSTARLAGKFHFWGQQFHHYTGISILQWFVGLECLSTSPLGSWTIITNWIWRQPSRFYVIYFSKVKSSDLFPSWKNERSAKKIFVLNPLLLLGCVAQSSLNANPLFIITLKLRHSLIVEDKSTSDEEQRRKTRRQFEVFLPGCAQLVIFSCSLFFMASSEFSPGVHQSRAQFCVYKGRGKMMRLLCLLLRRQLWGGLFRSKKFLKGATAVPGLTPAGWSRDAKAGAGMGMDEFLPGARLSLGSTPRKLFQAALPGRAYPGGKQGSSLCACQSSAFNERGVGVVKGGKTHISITPYKRARKCQTWR